MRVPAWSSRALSIGARVVIAAVLLGIILSRVDLMAVGLAARHLSPELAALASLVILLVGLITAAKWWVLLRALDVPVRRREVVRLTYIAVTWNLALPGGESGNLVKAALLARRRPQLAGAVWASMLVDQFSLAAGLSVMAIVTLTLAQQPPANEQLWLPIVGVGLAIVCVAYGAFLFPVGQARIDALVARISRALLVPRWLRRIVMGAEVVDARQVEELAIAEAPAHLVGEWLGPLWNGLTRYRGHRVALIGAIAIATIYYATIFSAYWLAARGLGLSFSYPDIAWVMALVGLASLVPITVAGAGVRDGIIIYFFTQRGVPAATALAFSLLAFALNVVLGIPGIITQMVQRPISAQISANN